MQLRATRHDIILMSVACFHKRRSRDIPIADDFIDFLGKQAAHFYSHADAARPRE